MPQIIHEIILNRSVHDIATLNSQIKNIQLFRIFSEKTTFGCFISVNQWQFHFKLESD